MARDRNAARFLKAQENSALPPTRQIGNESCRIFNPDIDMLKVLGRDEIQNLKCPDGECEILRLFKTCGKPLEMEIGFGMGRFLKARAKNNPQTHFLGIELEQARVARTDVGVRNAKLDNVTLLRAQANNLLRFCIPDVSLNAVYLFFPDPWPKPRHHKNRIFQPRFIDMMHRVLVPGGLLHVMTDDVPYYTQMREVMENEVRFVEVEPLKRKEDELTDFELKFAAKNKAAHALSWKKL